MQIELMHPEDIKSQPPKSQQKITYSTMSAERMEDLQREIDQAVVAVRDA